jgi:hypothetical protein
MIRDLSRLFALKARLRKPRPKTIEIEHTAESWALECMCSNIKVCAGRNGLTAEQVKTIFETGLAAFADAPGWDTEEPSTIPAHDCEPLPKPAPVKLKAEAVARLNEKRVTVDGRAVAGVREARIVIEPHGLPTLYLEVTDFDATIEGFR